MLARLKLKLQEASVQGRQGPGGSSSMVRVNE